MLKVTLYTAPWCNPCKALKEQWKSFDIFPEEDKDSLWLNMEFVDIDAEPEKGMEAGVKAVPTTVITKDNVEVERLIGVYAVPTLIERLKND